MSASMRWGSRKGVGAGLLALSLLVPLSAQAFEFRTGDQVSVAGTEVISEDFYAAGGNISLTGPMNGDLIAGGGTVVINSNVAKDAMLSGGTVTVIGNVAESIRAAGGTIVINGMVGGDVIAGGGSVILNGSKVGGDVAIGGGSIEINSPVAGDVRVAGGNIRINAPIGGSLIVKGGKVTLGKSALVNGAFTYTAVEKATMEDGAKVVGPTTFTQSKAGNIGKGVAAGLISFFLVIKFFAILLAALLFGLILKRYSGSMVETASLFPLREFGRGAITMIVLPVASLLLIATLVGIPLGLIGILAFIIFIILSAITTPIVIGGWLYKKIWKPEGYVVNWKTILLGVVVYFVLSFIPILGWLAIMVTTLITIGVVVKSKWEIVKSWR